MPTIEDHERLEAENTELLHLLRMAIERLQDIESLDAYTGPSRIAWMGLEAIAILSQREIYVANMLGKAAPPMSLFVRLFQNRPVHLRSTK